MFNYGESVVVNNIKIGDRTVEKNGKITQVYSDNTYKVRLEGLYEENFSDMLQPNGIELCLTEDNTLIVAGRHLFVAEKAIA